MRAGPRDRLITFQRYVTSEDAFGSPVEADEPTEIGKAWAQVLFGRGDERREAARESATLSATFRVLANSMTAAVKTTDEIAFDGGLWDIESNVPLGRDAREITATRRTI